MPPEAFILLSMQYRGAIQSITMESWFWYNYKKKLNK